MTMASEQPPAPGTPVVTADGEALGTVKEVAGTCFKVDARMRPDSWLANDTIASDRGKRVVLTVTTDRLDAAKVAGPAHTGLHRHDPGQTVL